MRSTLWRAPTATRQAWRRHDGSSHRLLDLRSTFHHGHTLQADRLRIIAGSRPTANTFLRCRPRPLPGEIYGKHGAPGVEPFPLLGPRLDISAQRGDYTQVGDRV